MTPNSFKIIILPMKTSTGFKFRCYPTPEQAQTLLRWVGCQRFIYNAKVSEDRYYRKFARAALGLPEKFPPIDQQYSRFINPELTPWLREVPSQVLRNGATRWVQAYGRYFKKLSGRPVFKKKIGRQSIWLTSELFEFSPVVNAQTGEILKNRLILGTKKFPVGDLLFSANRDYKTPRSVWIGVEAGQWYVSFSNEDVLEVPEESETLEWLRSFSEEELLAMTFGGDLGVSIPLAGSGGEVFDFEDVQKLRMEKKLLRIKRYQRRMARQRLVAGSNYQKTKKKLARSHLYGKNVREDFAHKVSHSIVSNPSNSLIVFEDLNVKGMTKKPRAKKNSNGKWARNNASSKAGLSKKILGSSWGKILTYTKYKAVKAGKLCIKINPFQTSQECFQCGHIHPDNRISQSRFVCQACGHQDNADHNASKVIARRGVRLVLSDGYSPRERRRCTVFRQQEVEVIGPVRSEFTPGEFLVSRGVGNGFSHETLSQENLSVREETPTTTLIGV